MKRILGLSLLLAIPLLCVILILSNVSHAQDGQITVDRLFQMIGRKQAQIETQEEAIMGLQQKIILLESELKSMKTGTKE